MMTSDDRSSGTHSSPRRLWLIAAICGVILIQALYAILVLTLIDRGMATRGQFGDIFGGVNALFTGLAFAGVIYTILLQRRELELQREELRLNRAELSRSAEAQTQQVERLEVAAELSAISSLVNTYGTLLQPLREASHGPLVEMAYKRRTLDSPEAPETEKAEARDKLEQLQLHLAILEREWSEPLQKERQLVERLETLLGQTSQGNGAAQKTE
jgi:hypothetical protein